MKQKSYIRGIYYLLLFVCIIGGGVIIKIAYSVFLPVTFAVLFSFVLLPIIRNANKKLHIPWSFSILLVLILCGAVFYVIGNLLVSSMKEIIGIYPKYEQRFNTIYKIIAETLHLSYDSGLSFIGNLWSQLGVRTEIQRFALSLSSYFISVVKNLLLVLLLIIFLLAETHFFHDKINAAFFGKAKKRVLHIINNVIIEIMHFISIKFFISLATGLLIFVGTFAIGLDFPVIWGFIAFILNFIPTFGSIISFIITVLFSVLQFFPHISPMILTAILVLGTNMVLGNFLEPRIEGKNLGISPFIILVSLSLWGWMWGFPGMILAVPITVILKIICENISFLHPVAILLGNNPKDTEMEFSPTDENDDDLNTTEKEFNEDEIFGQAENPQGSQETDEDPNNSDQ